MKQILMVIAALFFIGEVAAQQATATGSATAYAGNSLATAINGTGNTQQLSISGGEIPKQLPQPPVAAAALPNLFQFLPNQAGMPAELTGAPLDAYYLSVCNPRGGGKRLKANQKADTSSNTRYAFTKHQNLVPHGDVTPEVSVELSGKATIRCLGIITISVTPEAAKQGIAMGLAAITNDAMDAVADILKGVSGEIVLVSHVSFWGGGLGVVAKGSGTTGGVGINVGVSLAAGASSVDGVNFPMSRGGMTYVVGVRAPSDDPSAVTIDVAPRKEVAQTESVGGNGRKLQATQQ